MKKKVLQLAFGLLLLQQWGFSQPFAATDGLGRVLPQHDQVGNPRSDRTVALFYFLWQGDPTSPISEQHWDLYDLYHEHPAVFENFDDPNWGGGAGIAGRYYFWGQPIYGYYHGGDYWVHLKNMQLLTDAGVDVLILDATNRLTYLKQANTLMQAIEAIKRQGKNPPKLAFYTNTRSGETMQELYDSCYKADAPYRHPDTWFYLEGKPLIIGLSNEAVNRKYAAFFTIRESQWPNEPQKAGGWPWIDFNRPQQVYVNKQGQREIINVSTAQHPNLEASMGGSAFYGKTGNWGRSYHQGAPGNAEDLSYGYNIQEQWNFALRQDVPFIFVTGWNEWIAGKWQRKDDKKHALFVDQASPEYSRDIEPSLTADLKDHYYMQLVSNIRRYKGIAPLPSLSPMKRIGSWADWTEVFPTFGDYTGDVLARDYPGAPRVPTIRYVDRTGRNDFKQLKVAQDQKYLYCYAETVDPITTDRDSAWMNLWLDVDRSQQTGWCGYDYRVIAGDKLQHFAQGKWTTIAKVTYQLSKNRLMITIPQKLIGITPNLNIEFKWSDNMQQADPLDWYVHGDAAPGGRFNFVALRK